MVPAERSMSFEFLDSWVSSWIGFHRSGGFHSFPIHRSTRSSHPVRDGGFLIHQPSINHTETIQKPSSYWGSAKPEVPACDLPISWRSPWFSTSSLDTRAVLDFSAARRVNLLIDISSIDISSIDISSIDIYWGMIFINRYLLAIFTRLKEVIPQKWAD